MLKAGRIGFKMTTIQLSHFTLEENESQRGCLLGKETHSKDKAESGGV